MPSAALAHGKKTLLNKDTRKIWNNILHVHTFLSADTLPSWPSWPHFVVAMWVVLCLNNQQQQCTNGVEMGMSKRLAATVALRWLMCNTLPLCHFPTMLPTLNFFLVLLVLMKLRKNISRKYYRFYFLLSFTYVLVHLR